MKKSASSQHFFCLFGLLRRLPRRYIPREIKKPTATTTRKKIRMYIIVLVYIEKPWWHGCGFDKLSTIYSLLFRKYLKHKSAKCI